LLDDENHEWMLNGKMIVPIQNLLCKKSSKKTSIPKIIFERDLYCEACIKQNYFLESFISLVL